MMQTVSPTALAEFAAILQAYLATIWAAQKNVGPAPTIEVQTGPKYARLVTVNYGQKSAYGFVDLTTGNLLKSASWKAPAKGVRGNIFADNPLSGCNLYGMVYFK